MTTLGYVILWVFPIVIVSVCLGFLLGRLTTRHERKTTLQALVTLIQSTEKLSYDVDSHNHRLEDVGRNLGGIDVPEGLEDVQQVLLLEIAELLASNRKLEDDLVVVRYQMEEQAQELDRTRREARTDVLSGVPNRHAFDEELGFWLSTSKRRTDPFALVLADVDHFKWINDTHGHLAGDRVVSHVGAFLKDTLRQEDFVARIGGDEFAILLKSPNIEDAEYVAERIREGISQKNFNVGQQGERVAVTFSMGLTMSEPEDTRESLMNRADQGLYHSKKSGRNHLSCA